MLAVAGERSATAVSQLKGYLQGIYARYHLPIWLTEFALANWDSGGRSTAPFSPLGFL
ncbi:MAG: glycosyl hydrolase [Streptosporangiaceae bacterium]